MTALRDRLLDVTAALAGAASIDDITRLVLLHARYAVAADAAVMWLVEGAQLRVVAQDAAREDVVAPFATMRIDAELPLADAMRRREPVLIVSRAELAARYPDAERLLSTRRDVGPFAAACVPLVTDGDALGAFVLSFRREHVIDEDERAFLILLSRHCALALCRATSFEAEKRARQSALQTYELAAELAAALAREDVARTIVRHATASLGATRSAVWIAEPLDGEILRCIDVHYPGVAFDEYQRVRLDRDLPVCEVARSGWPVVIAQREEYVARYPALAASVGRDTEALVAMPLRAGERVIGAYIATFTEPGRLTHDALASFGALAHHSSLAMERVILLDEQRIERARAEHANRLKDEFLATISHELRTPLNAIKGWVRLLRAGTLPEEKHAHALDVIERNTDAQTRLISDLLDVGRILSGKLRMSTAPVDLARIAALALDSVRPLAEQRSVDVVTALDDAGAVRGDAERLQQVVTNLLTNAIKFSPAGGRVWLAVQRESEGMLSLSVSDRGEGISAEFLPYVFERFRQADGSFARRHGGLGLGLAIARSIVEQHGGTIDARSEGLGRGSTFTVRLPIASTRTAATRRKASGKTAAVLGPRVDLSGVRVLVVEDEPDARELVVSLLEDHGAIARGCGNARAAMEAFVEDTFDVLVSDVGLPGEDGHSMVRRIRSQQRAASRARTPAIALTAYARDEDRVRSLESGFDRHLVKPIAPETLLATVAELVAKR
ncbi:hybrid sensor histidine kinase/response regulator [Sandaracinus amylolyticus]|uniref:histidine kinase n=1 Tax=Sandaracinus amylolyticus TaxID=927083 RepID=A0A0F6W041_9BACT|nr:ATP-binding protein [Sandaracinus amylolyticus]AKF04062.1 two-component sensor histidine kinase [Sandaracinus amylolyticus]